MNSLAANKPKNSGIKDVGFGLLTVPFFKPPVFVTYPAVDTLFDVWRVVSILIAVVYLAYRVGKGKEKLDPAQKLLWLYCVYMLFVTIINRASITQWVLLCVAPVCFVFWIYEWGQYSSSRCINGLLLILLVLVIFNLISYFATSGEGMAIDKNGGVIYLLGMRTRWTDVFIPVIGLLMFRASDISKVKNLLIWILAAALIVYQIVLEWVVTAIIGIALLSLLYAQSCISRKPPKMTTLFCIAIAFNIAIVFFHVQDYFGWLLTDVFHKDVGLNSRVMIWDAAIEIIQSNWLVGAGFTETTSFVPLYGGSLIAQGHSLILQVLHDGGLIGLVLFCGSLFALCRMVDMLNDVTVYRCALPIVVSVLLGVSEIYFYHIYVYSIFGVCCFACCNRKGASRGKQVAYSGNSDV